MSAWPWHSYSTLLVKKLCSPCYHTNHTHFPWKYREERTQLFTKPWLLPAFFFTYLFSLSSTQQLELKLCPSWHLWESPFPLCKLGHKGHRRKTQQVQVTYLDWSGAWWISKGSILFRPRKSLCFVRNKSPKESG